jgi:hypothetical protein
MLLNPASPLLAVNCFLFPGLHIEVAPAGRYNYADIRDGTSKLKLFYLGASEFRSCRFLVWYFRRYRLA